VRCSVRVWWSEIARVLAPGGTYLSQEVGPASLFELVEYFLGPQSMEGREPTQARAMATAAGLEGGGPAPRLRDLHDQIQAEGPFVAHTTRFVIEVHRPS
jgi:hypothetical protein